MRKPPKGKSAHNLSGKRTVCDWHSGKSEQPFRAEGVSAAVGVRESLRLLTEGRSPAQVCGTRNDVRRPCDDPDLIHIEAGERWIRRSRGRGVRQTWVSTPGA